MPVAGIHQPDLRRRRFLQGLAGLGLGAAPFTLWARPGVQRLRMSVDGSTTRLVFDMDGPADYDIFPLDSPHRVVVDLAGARVLNPLEVASNPRSLVAGVRYAQRNGTDLRVVLDLRAPVDPHSFVLLPAQGSPHRLVLDLTERAAPVPVARIAPETFAEPAERLREPLREVIVAIDPGHGGHDPGAIGPGGTREKDVVLQIARRLAERVEREPGMRPVMIRTGDYFLPLRERIDRARAAQADVFLSIHADAIHDRRVQGSSVYILSDRGASSEAARFLAQRENSADLRLGGVPIESKDESLTSVLLDLAQSGTLEASHSLAQRLISEMHRVGKVRKPEVERASFAVLRSPDVPSVLVEAAFISNPSEERKLRTQSFQNSLADAILTGLRAYFSTHAPPGTLIAEGRRDRHIIRPGETLSAIAERYRMSVADLRAVNDLPNDRIFAGQVLQIPYRGS
ncbi:N-acetylmuramoyl-L-alanine amidase [Thioalkalivibrio nitratireducens DSM 14787]|uniref:N-acetylmuramoyl-L-alanine amidase AmiC n=1 Tax=Thioalkalivibrio nitratireducens (strain DSM 14787 / UNIQEM 213 / ALEN2) TaxID=1255043 RepID=L0DZF2_THIND|nr:N-acetylmuramoyl-L-alanine amidase [Thioalkalivibrio nitratireducens]AGA34418.1 N-acetylmuramoyl-L-alanine amidase [Thioalkalivibrio nitratireducens DSM 14787]